MRVLLAILGSLFLLIGLLFLLGGFTGPSGYNLVSASAPQVAQVYSQSNFTLAQGNALLVLATICFAGVAAISPAQPNAAAHHCPRCGVGINAGQRFCGNCALALDPASIAAWQATAVAPQTESATYKQSSTTPEVGS